MSFTKMWELLQKLNEIRTAQKFINCQMRLRAGLKTGCTFES
ncbi:hypothetical protein LEP1GSC126_3018 [Leptospira kirschneri str. 200801774]|nr:hypothetical protein LEP1GSC126_3018 [Leptospira kirschneri str. 200801774]